VNLAYFLLMRREDLTQPPAPREVAPGKLMGFLIILLCLAAMVGLLKFLLPALAEGREISNPAVVIPFWGLWMVMIFCRWRGELKMIAG